MATTTEYSDNVDNQPDPAAEEEFTQRVTLGAGIDHQATNWQGSADYQLAYREYIRNVLDDSTILTGSSRISWQPRTGVNLSATQRRNEQARDRRQDTDSPSNQQITNTTGVTASLSARPSPVDTVSADVGVTRRASQQTANTRGSTGNDSWRYETGASWNHRVSVPLSAGMRVNGRYARFDSSTSRDLKSVDMRGTLSRSGSRLNADASLGYSVSKRDGGKSTGGISASIGSTFTINQTQNLSLNLSRQVDDRDDDAQLFGDTAFDVLEGNGARSAVGINTNANLTYSLRQAGFNVATSLGYSKSEFDESEGGQGDESFSAGLNGSYSLSRKVSIRASSRFRTQRFPGQRKDDSLGGNIGVTWRGLKDIGFSGQVGWNQRDRDNAAANTRELSASISLSYTIR